MSDLVQDGVEDFFRAVAFDEVDRQLDGSTLIDTESHRLFASVESERPTSQAVSSHQFKSQVTGVPGTLRRTGNRSSGLLCRRSCRLPS